MHVAISGSSGLLGTALVGALDESGHRVTRILREATANGRDGVFWDPASGILDTDGLAGVDALVNLSGRSIGERRWSETEKQLLRHSRIGPTRLLAEALAGMDDPPGVLLNASAIGIYGDRGDDVLTEDRAPGEGFFPDLCRDWEEAAGPAVEAGIRVVNLRTSIVLSSEGGAIGRLLAPFGPSWLSPYRWGLGGWIGSGRQWWSWISIDDQVRAMMHLLDSDLAGPVNLTSPTPVTNKAFLKAVGEALRRPVWLPIPKFVLRMVLGSELAEATLFDSQRVVPERLLEDGFEFRDLEVRPALAAVLSRG
jgi:uncharacterized protein (TIGR01777 family)